MPQVEIFYSQMCSLCHEAMDYFRAQGIPFEAYEIHWGKAGVVPDDNGQEFIRRCGDLDFVPQIFIDGSHIKGWHEMSQLIETGEIQKLLKDVH